MNPFRFSSRTDWNLTSNELSQRVSQHRQRGKLLLDLTESNPTRCDFSYPKERILGTLSQEENFSYEPALKGLLLARNAVSRYYKSTTRQQIDPEHLFLTASTSEAYSFVFRLLANPGDEILVPRPSYPLFDFLARLNDIVLMAYSLEYHKRWRIDFDSIKRALSPNTRAVLVVNPNNPTGSGIPLEEREALLALCREHRLALISDEVFLDFEFSSSTEESARRETPQINPLSTDSTPRPNRLRSFVGTSETLTFCLNGISKMLGLPQMKLAWITCSGPKEWLIPALERLEVIADTYLSVGTPIQRALPVLLDEVRPAMQTQILARLQSNLRALDERLAKTGGLCERLVADGGWSAVISIPRTLGEDSWVLRWLEQDDVLVHPGYFFDFERPGYLVVSLILPEKIFREGIHRIISRIEAELKNDR